MNGQFEPGNKAQSSESAKRKRLARDLLTDHQKDAVAEIVNQLKDEDPSNRQWAVKMIMEYTVGKPAQAVEHTGKDGGAIAIIQEYNPKDG